MAGLRIWLEVGQREPIIFHADQTLSARLVMARQTIFWRQVDDGHDVLYWRGRLTVGLIQLWQPPLSHPWHRALWQGFGIRFSNPFDDPQGWFYILRNDQQQYSLWPVYRGLPADWTVVCSPQSTEARNAWLTVNWSALTPAHHTS